MKYYRGNNLPVLVMIIDLEKIFEALFFNFIEKNKHCFFNYFFLNYSIR